MLNPQRLVEALVNKLRTLPGLVTLLGEDPERIKAYNDQYPFANSLEAAIYALAPPALLVAWEESGPGAMARREVWQHRFRIILRASRETDRDIVAGYYDIWEQIVNGIPSGETLRFHWSEIHPACYLTGPPHIRRRTVLLAEPQTYMDFFEISLTLTEKGDY